MQKPRRSIAGSVIGGIKETQEMLDFCSKHNISSDIECIPIQKVKVISFEYILSRMFLQTNRELECDKRLSLKAMNLQKERV